jgi:hypothetical protein
MYVRNVELSVLQDGNVLHLGDEMQSILTVQLQCITKMASISGVHFKQRDVTSFLWKK